MFKVFGMEVEREIGRQLKCVRANNGGASGFRKLCPRLCSIMALAKIMNITICEKIKCMLSQAKLLTPF